MVFNNFPLTLRLLIDHLFIFIKSKICNKHFEIIIFFSLYYFSNKRTIDDPLAVFQRILRERDSKRRDMRGRHSVSRSRSRSISRSRSRERSRSLSRSPSRIIQHRTRSMSR